MRSAAVGFQCPSCVSEGAKATRSGRTAYGGKQPDNPALTSQVLIALNVAVFLLIQLTGGRGSVWLERLALIPRGRCELLDGSGFLPGYPSSQCALEPGQLSYVPGVADGAVWQLLTSAFTHLDLWHVGFNMVALWVLGPQLEMVLGRLRFLGVYFLSALAGSAMVYWFSDPFGPTIGASGAIFGLMGGLLVAVYKVRGNVQPLLMWIGLNFVITVIGRSFISWQGHLGGFLGGLAVAAAFVYAPRDGRTRWQLAAAVGIGMLIALAIAARTVVLA